MSEFVSLLGDLYAFLASQPYVAMACLWGLGGLLLGMGAGRGER